MEKLNIPMYNLQYNILMILQYIIKTIFYNAYYVDIQIQ